jgi:hypothetical protein
MYLIMLFSRVMTESYIEHSLSDVPAYSDAISMREFPVTSPGEGSFSHPGGLHVSHPALHKEILLFFYGMEAGQTGYYPVRIKKGGYRYCFTGRN